MNYFDYPAVQKVMEISGIKELNPGQRKALESGLLETGNFVVAAPTASGKTLLAEMKILDIVKKNKKALYIVPLRALANEKYDEFKEKYEKIGLRISISVGDMDSADSWLGNYDIIICTSEKLDSLMRHESPWINSVGLVVVDEIHLLDSPDRGPTLEIVLTKLRQLVNPQILGLSATISNYQELADWLDAKSVKSDYRPVKLYKGVYYDGEIAFNPKKDISLQEESNGQPVLDLVSHTLKIKKQALVFISTRKHTESAAEKISDKTFMALSTEEAENLVQLSNKIENAVENKTAQCERLANCVRKGSAFHHAGLANQQRKLVEEGFKKGWIKILTATPTLAAGVNIPAYRVIIRDLKRFAKFKGMDYLPAMEIEQMVGRAGRPKYETEGEGILIPKTKAEAVYAWEKYIQGQPEKIYSKLGVEPVLRVHTLALIASGTCHTKSDIFNFFSKTFYAKQFEDFSSLKIKIEKVLDILHKFKFITRGDMETGNTNQAGFNNPFKSASSLITDEHLEPTLVGKRVSELYIDPVTANYLVSSMEKTMSPVIDFSLLHTMCRCLEARPLISVKKGDIESINEIIVQEIKNLVEKPPQEWDIEYEDYLASIKTASFFKGWIGENGEDKILEIFGVTPGELRARLDIADWLLYSMSELALLLDFKEILKDIRKLRVRMEYGIKEELLALIKLKGIGRARSRLLFNAGVKDLGDVKKIPIESLSRLVGPKIAENLKGQVGISE